MFSVFCVWTVSWIFYCISLGRFSWSGFFTAVLIVLFFILSVCLSVSTHYCVNKDYQYASFSTILVLQCRNFGQQEQRQSTEHSAATVQIMRYCSVINRCQVITHQPISLICLYRAWALPNNKPDAHFVKQTNDWIISMWENMAQGKQCKHGK